MNIIMFRMGKEKRRKLQAIILNMAVLTFLLLASCSPVYYGPSAPVLSGFEEKGDVSITAGAGYSDRIRSIEFFGREPNAPAPDGGDTSLEGADLSVAFSPIDHLFLQYNLSYFYGDETNSNGSAERYSGNALFQNVGIGWYNMMSENISWENTLTFGRGRIDVDSRFNEELDASLVKYGVQSGLFYKKKIMELGGILGLSKIKYDDIEGVLEFRGVDQVSYLINNDEHLLLEPGFVFRIGHENIKFQVAANTSFNLIESDFRQNNFNISFGAQFAFNAHNLK